MIFLKFIPMRITFSFLIILFLSTLFLSCDNDEDFNHDPSFRLSFSKDSLSFDTIFSSLPSTTQQLKVYNTSSKSILIDEINLQNNVNDYLLNINGIEGNSVKHIQIPANDSLFIFVKLIVEDRDEDNPYLLEDFIQFTFNSKIQRFLIKSWGQDIIRFTENEIKSQVWTSKRPYFIEEALFLKQNSELTINEGAKVYFKKDAGLHLYGNLNIKGSFDKPVFFGSYRREELYDNVPAQWNGLSFYSESKDNYISHLHLENAVKGLSLESEKNDNKLEMEYSKLLNFSTTGIKINNFDLKMHDVIVSNCGEQAILLEGDGNFEFNHCNFVNQWQISFRDKPCLSNLSNNKNNLKIANSIIWGTRSNELEIGSDAIIRNCLIKLSEEKQNDLSTNFRSCIFNSDPEFISVSKHDYNFKENSVLIDKALLDIANFYPVDFNGNSRISNAAPDIGSIEFIEKDE